MHARVNETTTAGDLYRGAAMTKEMKDKVVSLPTLLENIVIGVKQQLSVSKVCRAAIDVKFVYHSANGAKWDG